MTSEKVLLEKAFKISKMNKKTYKKEIRQLKDKLRVIINFIDSNYENDFSYVRDQRLLELLPLLGKEIKDITLTPSDIVKFKRTLETKDFVALCDNLCELLDELGFLIQGIEIFHQDTFNITFNKEDRKELFLILRLIKMIRK